MRGLGIVLLMGILMLACNESKEETQVATSSHNKMGIEDGIHTATGLKANDGYLLVMSNRTHSSHKATLSLSLSLLVISVTLLSPLSLFVLMFVTHTHLWDLFNTQRGGGGGATGSNEGKGKENETTTKMMTTQGEENDNRKQDMMSTKLPAPPPLSVFPLNLWIALWFKFHIIF